MKSVEKKLIYCNLFSVVEVASLSSKQEITSDWKFAVKCLQSKNIPPYPPNDLRPKCIRICHSDIFKTKKTTCGPENHSENQDTFGGEVNRSHFSRVCGPCHTYMKGKKSFKKSIQGFLLWSWLYLRIFQSLTDFWFIMRISWEPRNTPRWWIFWRKKWFLFKQTPLVLGFFSAQLMIIHS